MATNMVNLDFDLDMANNFLAQLLKWGYVIAVKVNRYGSLTNINPSDIRMREITTHTLHENVFFADDRSIKSALSRFLSRLGQKSP